METDADALMPSYTHTPIILFDKVDALIDGVKLHNATHVKLVVVVRSSHLVTHTDVVLIFHILNIFNLILLQIYKVNF